MSEYKEVTDFRKIALVVALPILLASFAIYFLQSTQIEFPEIEIPTIIIEEEQVAVITEPMIREEYRRFLNKGVSVDDVFNFQELSCATFDVPEDQQITTLIDQHQEIFDQRRLECNL